MREFFAAAAENTFGPGSVLVVGDVKLSGALGDLRKGFSTDWERFGFAFPLPNAKLGVRFAAPKLNAGVAPVDAARVEELWRPEKRPPPPPPPPPPPCVA